MRKGGKRKPNQKEEAKPENNQEECSSKVTIGRPKRVKANHPQSDPEYLEDPRNLQDLWKAAFPVGTEWDKLDSVYKYDWDFSNLEKEFEEGGKLYGIGNNKVYIFVCTEPLSPSDPSLLPVLVAVVSPFPPSDKIAVTSVQSASEEAIPMKQMKMDWIPYIPLENRGSQVDRLRPQIFVLGCNQRRAALKHLKVERVKKFDYCLPYLMKMQQEEVEQSTEVNIFFPAEPNPPVVCEFDWEFHEVEEFTDERIQEEELPADQKDAFMEFIREEVRKAKRHNREEREARKQAFQSMNEEERARFQNMKIYKFYPVQTPDTPAIFAKSPRINRYYLNAHEVL